MKKTIVYEYCDVCNKRIDSYKEYKKIPLKKRVQINILMFGLIFLSEVIFDKRVFNFEGYKNELKHDSVLCCYSCLCSFKKWINDRKELKA